MARVPYLEPSDLAAEDQDLLKRPIWLFKALVNSPKAARAFSGLGGYIRYGSKLDPRLRELAILQVGWLARSPYEWSHHVKLGHDFGVSDEDVRALIDDTAGKPTSLDRLHDVIVPPPVPWWPPAPGWLVIGFLLVLVLVCWFIRGIRPWQSNCYRREALKLLEGAHDPVGELPTLIKRAFPSASSAFIGILSAVPPLFAIFAMMLHGRSSDRRQGPERPPDFSHSATPSIVMVRSDDLHMS